MTPLLLILSTYLSSSTLSIMICSVRQRKKQRNAVIFHFSSFVFQDKAGNTALTLAAREGKLDTVTLLLGLGANLEHRVVLTLHYPSPTLPRFLSIFTQYASREHHHPFVISDYPHITMQFNPSRISYHSSMTNHK